MARHELSWMDDRVGDNTLQAVLDRCGRDGVPEWIGHLPEETAPRAEALQHRLSDLLNGNWDAHAERLMMASIAEWRINDQPVEVDSVTMRLARRTGTNMLPALAIMQLLEDWTPGTVWYEITHGPARRDTMSIARPDHRLVMKIPLARGVHWQSGSILLVDRKLPATVAASMHGRPLAHVIGDPDLDKLNLTITRIEERGAGYPDKGALLVTDYKPEWVALAGLPHEELAIDNSMLDQELPKPRAVQTENKPHF